MEIPWPLWVTFSWVRPPSQGPNMPSLPQCSIPFCKVCPCTLLVCASEKPSCPSFLPTQLSLHPAWPGAWVCPTRDTGFCVHLCWTSWGSRQPISWAVTYYRSVTTSVPGLASSDPAETQKYKTRDLGPISHKKTTRQKMGRIMG